MAGKERLEWGVAWVQEGAAQDIDSEGGGANGFAVHGRKGETERI